MKKIVAVVMTIALALCACTPTQTLTASPEPTPSPTLEVMTPFLEDYDYALVRGGQATLDYLDVVKNSRPLHPIEELPIQELPVEKLPRLNADDLALG